MKEIYQKNEFETNEIVSKTIRLLFGFVLVIGLFCWIGIFDISSSMINGFIIASLIPLLLPTLIVNLLHKDKHWVKYVLLLCVVLITGIAYVVFTFQMVLVFVVPSIIAAMYLDKKVYLFTGIATCINILVSHIITGFILFQPWIEPFSGMKSIILYGALPRTLQYLCCFGLLWALESRFSNFLIGFDHFIHENSQPNRPNDKLEEENGQKERMMIESVLTEREKDVFGLLVKGYTNAQIANHLCLSMGTVKNYVSIIYDKLELSNRTAIVLKFGPYYRNCD
ncbi:MAG TPA: LuxR C-terminal-related transcriptional regulator [Oscillospiraceae bacterium]|nr:LuxR C-terminal-related transcriptional regulator [Oscillospiraceae bacterium]